MYGIRDPAVACEFAKTGKIITFPDDYEMQAWKGCSQQSGCVIKFVYSFIALRGRPSTDRQHDTPFGKVCGNGEPSGHSASARKLGFKGQASFRTLSGGIACIPISFCTVSTLGPTTRSACKIAFDLSQCKRFQTSTPCAITIVLRND